MPSVKLFALAVLFASTAACATMNTADAVAPGGAPGGTYALSSRTDEATPRAAFELRTTHERARDAEIVNHPRVDPCPAPLAPR